jgi:uncharacterized protein (TIGR03086 family)
LVTILHPSLSSDYYRIVIDDLRSLHHQALAIADTYVADLLSADLSRATPCEGWSLADLLAHMIGQHRGFAQAMRHGDAPAEAYAPVRFQPAEWRESVDDLVAAFAEADLDQPVVEIELAPVPLPARRILAAQLIDTVVHTWDIAQARGSEFVPPDDLLAVSAEIAAGIPDQAYGAAGTGAAFGQRLPLTGDRWADTLALVGRRTPLSDAPDTD